MLHQYAQKLVLLGRQFHLLVAHPHDAPHQVDREIAGAEDFGVIALLMAITSAHGPAIQ
jgi:hypothetical protein